MLTVDQVLGMVKVAAHEHLTKELKLPVYSIRVTSNHRPPDTKLCASGLEAMRWINPRLALCGFEEAYRLG